MSRRSTNTHLRLAALGAAALLALGGCARAQAGDTVQVGTAGVDDPAAVTADAGDGSAGADSCDTYSDGSAATGVQCTFTSNGTWAIPSTYTTSDWWVTVQGLGGAGGDGYSTSKAPGGAAGQAQTTLSGADLSGATLYAYVGQDGYATPDTADTDVPYGGTGGSASMVTTTEVDWSAGTTAEEVDAVVVAGAGGAGGAVTSGSSSAAGGAGGIVVAADVTAIGSGSAGAAGSDSYGGQAPSYDADKYAGNDQVSGGFSASDLGSLCYGDGEVALGGGQSEIEQDPPWVANSDTLSLDDNGNAGGCADVGGGGGGGGHAGGGGGTTSWVNTGKSTGGGGGGGSSWAIAGASGAPSLADTWLSTSATSSTVIITIWSTTTTSSEGTSQP